jgi:hypothetical protein
MTYERKKVAPWEQYADGQWHPVREGPEDESRQESERQYRRHFMSMHSWCQTHRHRGQLSRTEYGRVLKVRITKIGDDMLIARMKDKSREAVSNALVDAVDLLQYGLHLRVHGENAPGGSETWREFDQRTEAFLRKVCGTEES